MLSRIGLTLLAAVALSAPLLAMGADGSEALRLAQRLESRFERIQGDPEELTRVRDQLTAAREQAQACIDELESELQVRRSAVEQVIGAASEAQPEGQRSEIAALESRLIDCQVAQRRATEWSNRVELALGRTEADRLLQRSQWWQTRGELPPLPDQTWLLILLAALAAGLVATRLPLSANSESLWNRSRSILRRLVLFTPLGVVLLYAHFGEELPWAKLLLLHWLAFCVASLAISAFPRLARPRLLGKPDLWLLITTVASFVAWTESDAYDLYRGAALLTAALALLIAVSALLRLREEGRLLKLMHRLALVTLSLAILGLAAARPALAHFLFISTAMSLLVLWAVRYLYVTSHRWLNDLDRGATPAQRWLRSHLAVDADEDMPGSLWLSIFLDICLLVGLGVGLVWAWRLTEFGFPDPVGALRGGFTVGEVHMVPANIFLGIVIFLGLLAVSGRIKRMISDRWIRQGRVGVRSVETIVTVLGYAGVVLAAVIGLTVAGFSFSNLALIAGALSVGIGFGLQNVVNNFVSGLILLFERPVKTGDWIKVGETQGFVQRIRVRSTEIQSFDKSEIIVPNSELISNQVTNWTLHSGIGRIIISVGVAYGSDTEQVKELLLTVAHEHPKLIQDQPNQPKVLFTAFGDSALQFELRAFLPNILETWEVKSELHFAIERTFRAHGIQIPFPQRDVHLYKAKEEE